MVTLKELRNEIDEIDEKILDLIEKRATVVEKVGELKKETSHAIYVPKREFEIFEKLGNRAKHINKDNVRAIYTEIISACRALEKKISVTVAGDKSDFISYKIFGYSIELKKIEKDKLKNIDSSKEKLKEKFENADILVLNTRIANSLEGKEELIRELMSRTILKIEYKDKQEFLFIDLSENFIYGNEVITKEIL